MSRIRSIQWSKLIESIESADLGKHGRDLSWNDNYVADYQFDDPKLRQRVGELISQARRNIPFVFRRPELLAALSVVAVLIAGALAKAGYAWWAIALISVHCIFAIAVEQRVSPQWIGRALVKGRHALKSTLATIKQGTVTLIGNMQTK